MRDNLQLPAEFFETVAEGLHSSRIEREGDALIAVFNDVHFDFAFEPSELAALWICARANLVVTARRSPLRSVDHLRTAVRSGEHIASSIALLTHLLHAQADSGRYCPTGYPIDMVEDDPLGGPRPSANAQLARSPIAGAVAASARAGAGRTFPAFAASDALDASSGCSSASRIDRGVLGCLAGNGHAARTNQTSAGGDCRAGKRGQQS